MRPKIGSPLVYLIPKAALWHFALQNVCSLQNATARLLVDSNVLIGLISAGTLLDVSCRQNVFGALGDPKARGPWYYPFCVTPNNRSECPLHQMVALHAYTVDRYKIPQIFFFFVTVFLQL